MKKTYNQPAVTVTAIKAVTPLASSPIGGKVYGSKNAESGQYGLAREDNAWDIWGNNADDFDD